jgi:3-phenylpropionate/cinnamic acid dioxygenase small subunit
MIIDKTAAEKFLYSEAEFLDDNKFDEWLSLWTDDATYWVPCNDYDIDPTEHVSLIYDDKAKLEARVERLKSEAAWGQNPRSRFRRIISNVMCEEGGGPELTVYSNFILHELRRHVLTVWAGRSIHRLREVNGKLRMSYKKVLLLSNDEFIPNMAFLV